MKGASHTALRVCLSGIVVIRGVDHGEGGESLAAMQVLYLNGTGQWNKVKLIWPSFSTFSGYRKTRVQADSSSSEIKAGEGASDAGTGTR